MQFKNNNKNIIKINKIQKKLNQLKFLEKKKIAKLKFFISFILFLIKIKNYKNK